MTRGIDLDRSSAAAALSAVRGGELHARELVEYCLERVQRIEPAAHAYVALDASGAARRAEELDADPVRSGALTGLPIGVKDLISTRRRPAGAGAARQPQIDDPRGASAVAALEGDGAIVLGAHVSLEHGLGVDLPVTRTPWAPQRYAGGSTVGGGVSVATGTSFAAIGTDGAGSIRKPAEICSVVGFKPSSGVVPLDGVFPGATSIDVIGWITRTVEDAALLLGTFQPRPAAMPGLAPGARVGLLSETVDDSAPEVAAALETAVSALGDVGVAVEHVVLPHLFDTERMLAAVAQSEGYSVHARHLATEPEVYSAAARAMLAPGAVRDEPAVADGIRLRNGFRVAVLRAMRQRRLDALLLPTMPLVAQTISEARPPAEMLEAYTRYTRPFNLTGQPAISLPVAQTEDGVGIGVQLVGSPWADAELLGLAAGLERALGVGFAVRPA